MSAARSALAANSNIDHLCCGLAGRAYSLLALYRGTEDSIWFDGAWALAGRAMSAREAAENRRRLSVSRKADPVRLIDAVEAKDLADIEDQSPVMDDGDTLLERQAFRLVVRADQLSAGMAGQEPVKDQGGGMGLGVDQIQIAGCVVRVAARCWSMHSASAAEPSWAMSFQEAQ